MDHERVQIMYEKQKKDCHTMFAQVDQRFPEPLDFIAGGVSPGGHITLAMASEDSGFPSLITEKY